MDLNWLKLIIEFVIPNTMPYLKNLFLGTVAMKSLR